MCPTKHTCKKMYTRMRFLPPSSLSRAGGKRLAGPFEPGLKLRGKLFAVTPDARYLVYGGAWDFSLRIFSLGKKGGEHALFCGSGMFSPGSQSEFFPSRIRGQKDSRILDPGPHPRQSILTPKNFSLSSRKYDPGCSSRIRILIFLPISDPGSWGQKGTGSRIPGPQHWKNLKWNLFRNNLFWQRTLILGEK